MEKATFLSKKGQVFQEMRGVRKDRATGLWHGFEGDRVTPKPGDKVVLQWSDLTMIGMTIDRSELPDGIDVTW